MMDRRGWGLIALGCLALSVLNGGLLAQRPTAPPPSTTATTPAPKTTASVACTAELGAGLKTKRSFCDVVIAKDKSESISVTLPPHKGTATLSFDLHNRFGSPEAGAGSASAYARHEAVVAVVGGPTAAVLQRLVVRGEYRGPASLFDRIGGGSGPGGAKVIGPGPAESVRVTIPATLSAVGVVGLKLTVTTSRGTDVFDSPGLPVAIASNFKVEFTPK
jgi:hypothetical protein